MPPLRWRHYHYATLLRQGRAGAGEALLAAAAMALRLPFFRQAQPAYVAIMLYCCAMLLYADVAASLRHTLPLQRLPC